MKWGTLLLLLLGLWGIASSANAARLSAADRAHLQEAIESAKEVLREIPLDVEYARRIELSLISSAYAFTEDFDCLFGGWPSKRSSSGLCKSPQSFSHYSENTQNLKCGHDTDLICNPLLFGPGKSGSGLCVSVATPSLRQSAFSQCETKFKSDGNYDFLTAINNDKKKRAELDQTLDLVNEICVTGSKQGSQKGTKMCEKFAARREAVRKLLETARTADGDTPPKTDVSKDEKTGVSNVQSDKTANAAGNSQSCSSCGGGSIPEGTHNRQKISSVVKAYSSKFSWEKPGRTDEQWYNTLKSNYAAKGKCHRYSQLPSKEQRVFFLKQFNNELDAVNRLVDRNSMTGTQAIESISKAMQWSADTESQWQKRLAGSKSSRDKYALERDLLKVLNENIDRSPLRDEAEKRVRDLFSQKGIQDCTSQDVPDFPSYDAFHAALEAVRAKGPAPKSGVLTVIDRSLPKTARRLITLDLNNDDVLYHSVARFGDADPAGFGPEADVCSNKDRSNASPYGLAIAENTRISRTKEGFPGMGTMLKTATRSGDGMTDVRGLAIHQGIHDVFSNFFPDQNETETPGSKLDKALQTGSDEDLKSFIYAGRDIRDVDGTYTNGCVGVPVETHRELQKYIEGGSFVYFHCPATMIRK